jgi:hypothetical protein
MRFVVKSRKVMGDYIALNWLEPEESSKFGIKQGQVFVRSDWWDNPVKRYRLQVHEKVEIFLRREFGFDYQKAHHLATLAEHEAIKIKGWKLDGNVKHKVKV